MPAKNLVDALDETTTALLAVAHFAQDEALRIEAMNAFERFMHITDQVKDDPRPERVRRHEAARSARALPPSADVIEATLARGRAL